MSRPVIVSPGPVDVSPEALRDLPPLHHRSAAYERVVSESAAAVREALGTKHPVHFLTASGTGAMEAAIANATAPGERLLVLSCGKFGDRWAEIGAAFGCEVSVLRVPDGAAVDVAAAIGRIRADQPRHVAVTHVESSTGSLFPLKELAARLGSERPTVIIDAVSSFAAEELEMDAWGIDVVAGASQKALGAPAGAGFVCMGKGAMRPGRRGLYYFDLRRYASEAGESATPFTPAVGTMQAIHRSLDAMRGYGFDAVRSRHRLASEAFLSACGALGLSVFPEEPSAAVQALGLPDGARGEDLLDALSRKGFIAAGGQGALRGRIVRTGFLGLYDGGTLLRLVRALSEALRDAGIAGEAALAEERMMAYSEKSRLFS